MKLLHVIGARPNYPKLAPVHRACRAAGFTQIVVDTGQHYDDVMAGSFLRDLGLPDPDVRLGVGSASHAVQTARIMERLEPVLEAERPDWVVVYGDVNSTLAASVVAAKLAPTTGVRTAHVEAGLRSGDRGMPEEINRLVTDRLADLLLTPSRDVHATLAAEGESPDKIVFVGNVMIDTLLHSLTRARETRYRESQGLAAGEAVLVTLHRPSNVDDEQRLGAIASALARVAEERPVIFPAHPRTRGRIQAFGLEQAFGKVMLVEPVPYLQLLDLEADAHCVVTDSGGLQEETTALGVPCFTLRDNTERPVTVTEGTNQLVRDPGTVPALVAAATPLAKRPAEFRRPDGWDGRAGERVAAALAERTERL